MMHLVLDTPAGLTDKDSHFPPTPVASTWRPLVMTDFAVVGQLIQCRPASLALRVPRCRGLPQRASFGPRLTTEPLPVAMFGITSLQQDFHLQAAVHAARTNRPLASLVAAEAEIR